jgi:hypothetical protein
LRPLLRGIYFWCPFGTTLWKTAAAAAHAAMLKGPWASFLAPFAPLFESGWWKKAK